MDVPLRSPASITATPREIPEMIRFRIGKFCANGGVLGKNSVTIAPRSITASYSLRFSVGYT